MVGWITDLGYFGMEKVTAMQLHLQEQIEIYGEQALVNLVNQKGHEKPVKDAYERYIAKVRSLTSSHDQETQVKYS